MIRFAFSRGSRPSKTHPTTRREWPKYFSNSLIKVTKIQTFVWYASTHRGAVVYPRRVKAPRSRISPVPHTRTSGWGGCTSCRCRRLRASCEPKPPEAARPACQPHSVSSGGSETKQLILKIGTRPRISHLYRNAPGCCR